MSRSAVDSTSNIRVILVDDEPLARENMRIVLTGQNVEIVGEAGTVKAAVTVINSARPDVVLLDIEMPDGSGFDVLADISVDPFPAVVFVTAYRDHAVEAFEVHAVDYVVKPFTEERLQTAVRHAARSPGDHPEDWSRVMGLLRRFEPVHDDSHAVEALPDQVGPRAAPARRLMVGDRGKHRVVLVDDIDYLTADGNYVRIHMGPEEHLVRTTLSALHGRLDPGVFIRVHRGSVLNLDQIDSIVPWFAGRYVAILKDGTRLRVSRTYREALLRLLH